MGNANVHSAANRLKHSLRDLLEHWDATRETWQDAVAREFEERQIRPLESATNAAMNGMQDLAEVLARVRADCDDRSRF